MEKYTIGQIIRCQVSGIVSYGMFVSINHYYNGLIHISEISSGFVRDINDFVAIGDVIYAKILDIDDEYGQMSLSIKNIDYKKKGRIKKIVESKNGFNPLKENLSTWTEEKIKEYNLK